MTNTPCPGAVELDAILGIRPDQRRRLEFAAERAGVSVEEFVRVSAMRAACWRCTACGAQHADPPDVCHCGYRRIAPPGPLPPAADVVEHTGTAASWCPICGDCTCPRWTSGEWIDTTPTPFAVAYERRGDCPLHAGDKGHP